MNEAVLISLLFLRGLHQRVRTVQGLFSLVVPKTTSFQIILCTHFFVSYSIVTLVSQHNAAAHFFPDYFSSFVAKYSALQLQLCIVLIYGLMKNLSFGAYHSYGAELSKENTLGIFEGPPQRDIKLNNLYLKYMEISCHCFPVHVEASL